MSATAGFLKVSDIAALLGVSPRRVYQLVRSRQVPALRIGGRIRIPALAWQKWIEQASARVLAEMSETTDVK